MQPHLIVIDALLEPIMRPTKMHVCTAQHNTFTTMRLESVCLAQVEVSTSKRKMFAKYAQEEHFITALCNSAYPVQMGLNLMYQNRHVYQQLLQSAQMHTHFIII